MALQLLLSDSAVTMLVRQRVEPVHIMPIDVDYWYGIPSHRERNLGKQALKNKLAGYVCKIVLNQ